MSSAELAVSISRTSAKAAPGFKSASVVPIAVQSALRKAIDLEGESQVTFNDFLWFIAQESGGIVRVRNRASTARGMFNCAVRNTI